MLEGRDESLVVEGFTPDLKIRPSMLDRMMAEDEKITMSTLKLFVIRKKGRFFAEGSRRKASHARTRSSTNRYVIRSNKKGRHIPLSTVAEEICVWALCKVFALEFNSLLGGEPAIDFLAIACLKGMSQARPSQDYMLLQPFLDGSIDKYNNNAGYIIDEDSVSHSASNSCAQAFSHFTFERSKGRFIACNLQGVGGMLMNPCIHTQDPEQFKLVDTNLNADGFEFFFSTHKCNYICRRLRLRSDLASITRKGYAFHETWIRRENMSLCASKLCQKIIRTDTAYSTHFSGRGLKLWCNTCKSQLLHSTVRQECHDEGCNESFDVSPFFFESQGLRTPLTCSKHYEDSGLEDRSFSLDNIEWDVLQPAESLRS